MVNTYNKSRLLYEEAQRYIPGGVNSPVRAFKAVGEHPVFIKEGFGSKMVDVDGNQYIDCRLLGPLDSWSSSSLR